ncbi:MAG: aminotransferase class V-fold PLP-dependent enzyme, partial [Bacteroidetes bacterium]|nr:aminotransferase class V-fold PLP-dependent enzyme [Bacteroidota bacterium]
MLKPSEMIRQEFPIFSSKELIYLDSAATTQKPHSVIKSIEEYYLESNANVHRGAYKLAQKATDLYERTRKAIKGFIHAASEQEIIFTRGTTESINLVAYSYLDQVLKKGDNVIISAMEHHSNLVPWQAACKRKHAELRIIPMNQAGELDMETFSNLLDNRTKMVAVVHISNSLGTVNPIEKIIQLAHQQGV